MFLQIISSTLGTGILISNSDETVFRGSLKKCKFLMNLWCMGYYKAFYAYRDIYQQHQLDQFETDQGFRDYETACLL